MSIKIIFNNTILHHTIHEVVFGIASDQQQITSFQKESNELLKQRLKLEEEKIKLKGVKNALLKHRNDIELKKVDALNQFALNFLSSHISDEGL